jgi:hypothetical protein
VLAEGAQAATGIAAETMREVKEALGLKAPRYYHYADFLYIIGGRCGSIN